MKNPLETGIHYEPLRPGRSVGTPEQYEFTHSMNGVCVYDIDTLDFVKEISVGTKPDCHATSVDNQYVYMACFEGLYCINLKNLAVEKIVDTGKIYATNTLPENDSMLVHDLQGGVLLLENITDMAKIHIASRQQVIPNGQFRSEIGGKGSFLQNGRYYLCNGWHQSKMYLFDVRDKFSFTDFIDVHPLLDGSDDLVISADHTKAYSACHCGIKDRAHVTVTDIEKRMIIKSIPTGIGSCGLTMTNDERYAIVSNDRDDSISVIDTKTDQVVNTPCAREGFGKLGIQGYIQGISCGKNDEIYVYGCAGNGAIVRFTDIIHANRYEISYPGGKIKSFY